MLKPLDRWNDIPYSLRGPLARYLLDGLDPGGFLTAIIRNDLASLILHHPAERMDGMVAPVMRFLHYCVPAQAHGSFNAMALWAASPNRRFIIPKDIVTILEGGLRDAA
ncbi:MAG: hypothetical protein AB7F96_15415 [Beijerinckiaceae bacterium]